MNILHFILCDTIGLLKFFHALSSRLRPLHQFTEDFTTATTDGAIEDFTTSDKQ